MIIKVSTQAERREQQQQMEQDFTDAGIRRIRSTPPNFYLIDSEDVKELTTIAGQYRCKPVIARASDEDVPDDAEIEEPTEDLVEFVHHLGYTFNWDEDTHVWCVSGLRDGFPDETMDEPAGTERAAAIEALRYLAS